MSWMKIFFGSGRSAPVASWDETVIKGVQRDAKDAIRGGKQNSFARPGAQISDETKRRQIALITRYVLTVRAR
jgi:hypothetical protein